VTNRTGVSVIEIVTIKFLILFVQSFISVKCKRVSLVLPKDARMLVFLKCCCAVIGAMCLNKSVSMIPLMFTQVLFNTAPFWLFIMSYALLGEALNAI